MPYVESKTTIKGDGAKIYDIIKDMEIGRASCRERV